MPQAALVHQIGPLRCKRHGTLRPKCAGDAVTGKFADAVAGHGERLYVIAQALPHGKRGRHDGRLRNRVGKTIGWGAAPAARIEQAGTGWMGARQVEHARMLAALAGAQEQQAAHYKLARCCTRHVAANKSAAPPGDNLRDVNSWWHASAAAFHCG